MPSTSLGIPYPASTDHVRLWEHIQSLAQTIDDLLDVPAEASASSTGANTITATTWAALPTPLSVDLTNPHPTRGLFTQVSYGAQLTATATDLRVCVAATGGLTIPAGIGTGGALSWGEVLYISLATSGSWSLQSAFTCTLPAGTTTTLSMQAYRAVATGTQTVNFPTLRATPLRYV